MQPETAAQPCRLELVGPKRRLVRLPADVALFWVRWSEEARFHEAWLTSGPVLCNDLSAGPSPPGKVSACVPFSDRAEAQFVPLPPADCGV